MALKEADRDPERSSDSDSPESEVVSFSLATTCSLNGLAHKQRAFRTVLDATCVICYEF